MADNKILNRSKFALLAECSRQNIKKLVDNKTLVLNKDGKLDITNPENMFWLEQRKNKTELKINNPGKTVDVKKNIKTAVKKAVKISKNKKTKLEEPETEDDKTENKEETLQSKKLRIEVQKLEEQRDKLIRENAVGRAELINKKELADRLFGFIIALLKNIMGMPAGYIDDFEAAVKSKNTRAEKINILTVPICEAIEETKTEIKKELRRITRELKK
jgi:hypothetical protein